MNWIEWDRFEYVLWFGCGDIEEIVNRKCVKTALTRPKTNICQELSALCAWYSAHMWPVWWQIVWHINLHISHKDSWAMHLHSLSNCLGKTSRSTWRKTSLPGSTRLHMQMNQIGIYHVCRRPANRIKDHNVAAQKVSTHKNRITD